METSGGDLQWGGGRTGASGSEWGRGHDKMARQDDRNQPAPPGSQPLLPGDLQPRHAEDAGGGRNLPLPHPALNAHLAAPEAQANRTPWDGCRAGRAPWRGRLDGQPGVKPRCQHGLGSKTFLRSFLRLLGCYLSRGLKPKAGSGLQHTRYATKPNQRYKPGTTGLAEELLNPQLLPLVDPGGACGWRAARAETEGTSTGRRSQEAATVPPARLSKERSAPRRGLPTRPPTSHSSPSLSAQGSIHRP